MVAHTMSVMLMETLGIVNKEVREDGLAPSILQPDEPSKGYRKNWARLIQKIGACPGPDPGKSIP